LQFETNLTSSRDITIYAKSSNENTSTIEVYERNQTQLIATFENITNESYYKIYLTNLTNPQDSFDLKIINSIDFDFVIDPVDSITINYPTNTSDNVGSNITINASITGSSVDSCFVSLDNQENFTMLLNLDKTFANYTYTNLASGYHNLTVYCNDTSNAFNSATLLNFFVNLPPNVTSVILTPATLDKNQNLICNFTISDDNPVVVWGEKTNVFAAFTIISFTCDSDFCYAGDNIGYFYKINKTSGVQIYNATEGYTNRLSNYGVYSLFCDSDFCYAGDMSGYFLKINKTSGVHIYNRTSGYTNQLSTNGIYSLFCDSDFCYGVDDYGYFLKINKTSGVHIYNRTSGYTNRLTSTAIADEIYCDSDFCYAGDTFGYFLKINKTSGVHIYNTTTGYVNQPSDYIRGFTCDSDFCYGRDRGGYFLKINKTSGVHIYNRTSGYTNKISSFGSSYMVAVSCDSYFCYTTDDSYSLFKIRKNSGEPLFLNITWYKNGIFNSTFQLEGIYNGTIQNTSLSSTNFTKGDNWVCEVKPYDTKSYGEVKNSSSSLIINSAPVINWLQINPPYYPSSEISAYTSFSDLDNDNATLYFKWYINGTNVENDTLTNIQSGSLTTTYLNASKNAGDVLNLSVYADDGTNTSESYKLNRLVWNTSSRLTPLSVIRSLSCDSDFCYGGDNDGYFLKINKTSGVQVYNTTTGYKTMLGSGYGFRLSCDSDFCYGGDYNGYFLKINKTSGVHIWNRTSGYTNQLSTNSISSLFCDSDFCYGGDNDGYFLKINKTSGVHIYNTTTGYQNKLSNASILHLSCDSDFCYGIDHNGYFLKINKTSGIHIYNTTPGYLIWTLNQSPAFTASGLSCDSDFCYILSTLLLDNYKVSFLRLNKTSGAILNIYPFSDTSQIGAISSSLFCDSVYCFAINLQGMLLQINKNSGVQIHNFTIGYTYQLSNNWYYSLYCDSDFCYAGDENGYIKKVLKQDNLVIKQGPEIQFVSPTTLTGNYSSNQITINITLNLYGSIFKNLTLNLYNGSGLINSTSWVSAGDYYSYTFSGLSDGHYSFNASVVNDEGIIGLSSTESIYLDTTAPIITLLHPLNNSIQYSNFVNINATLYDLYNVDQCLLSVDGNQNLTMSINYYKNLTNYSYTQFSHGYHNITISCNDSFSNRRDYTEYNVRAILPDLTISNVSYPELYSNYTLITINVSNNQPSNASNVNVSCYLNDLLFDSKLLTIIKGGTSLLTNCTKTLVAGLNQKFNITIDPQNLIMESNDSNNENIAYKNITQIANITLNSPSLVNTTEIISVNGTITGNDGTLLPNQKFIIKINNITVSTNTFNYSDFSSLTVLNVNASNGQAKLNLSLYGDQISNSYTYYTNNYTTENNVINYSSEGWYAPAGSLFWLDNMVSSQGNIIYRFDSPTLFYNASAYIETYANPLNPPGANTSLWYSFDNSNWNLLSSTTLNGVIIGDTIPNLNGRSTVYIKINSDTFSFSKENPVVRFEFNFSNYEYPTFGTLLSNPLYFPSVTYTILKWERQLNNGEIKVQLRESNDGNSWDEWSINYTDNLNTEISNFSKPYIQYKVWFLTSNQTQSPVLTGISILGFNATTDSNGNYTHNVTIPATDLGILPLEVRISQLADDTHPAVVGQINKNISIWANTIPVYSVERNYSQISNYSLRVNYTRMDTGGLINGTIKAVIYNSSFSSTKYCDAINSCYISWIIPTELMFGNYSINLTGYNESAYYRNLTIVNFNDYLEEKNTSGEIYIPSIEIADYNPNFEYVFYLNSTINNTGRASMSDIHVWSPSLSLPGSFANMTQTSYCSKLLPEQSCNISLMIRIKSGIYSGNRLITWRANWTDNDGGTSGGDEYISYESYINISENSLLNISGNSFNQTVSHGQNSSFNFSVLSIGTGTVLGINLTLLEGDIPENWLSFNPNYIDSLGAGETREVNLSIHVPKYTSPGNYSSIINVSSLNGGIKSFNLTINVPYDYSWYYLPSSNFTNNISYALNDPGVIANYTLINTGNTNLTINVSYLSKGDCICDGVLPCDYTCFGSDIFSTNYGEYNPTVINIPKGENSSFSIYQKGYSLDLNDVRIIVKFFNSNAIPQERYNENAFWINQLAPNITNIWFYLEGISGNRAEVNKNLTIKIRAIDDVNLNESSMKVNISYGASTTTLTAENLCGEYGQCVGPLGARTVANFSVNFTPLYAGDYRVKAWVYDAPTGVPKSFISQDFLFTSYRVVILNISGNLSSISTSQITKTTGDSFPINYVINNTGIVSAYTPSINFSNNNYISLNPRGYTFDPLPYHTQYNQTFQVNISPLTPPGIYNLNATINWRNPDNTLDSRTTPLTINVLSNKSFLPSPSSLVYNVFMNETSSLNLTLENTGNDLLQLFNFNCVSGALCSNFIITPNESNFNIPINNSKLLNLNLTSKGNLESGMYYGTLNISEKNVSQLVEISANVLPNWDWNLSFYSINVTKFGETSGNLQEVLITNLGNVNMTFEISSTNTSLISTNVSSLYIPLGQSAKFLINYTAPAEEGSYQAKINVTNPASSILYREILVNLTVSNVLINVFSPTSLSPFVNVSPGDNLVFLVNVSYQGNSIDNNITWEPLINNIPCSNLDYFYNQTNWVILCTAPNLSDGGTYDLLLQLEHPNYGKLEKLEPSLIIYKDITSPKFNITRTNVNKNQNISLIAEITDNVFVDNFSAILIYPNLSTQDVIFTKIDSTTYTNNTINLTLPGEYLINYTAIDSSGNSNSTLDWFEVYDFYKWDLSFFDNNLDSIPGIILNLLRPNTSTILVNGETDMLGKVSLSVNRRFYDIQLDFDKDKVIIKDVNLSNVSTSNLSLNLYKMNANDLSEQIPLYKPFIGFSSNSSGFSSNPVTIIFNYTPYNYESSYNLKIVKCESWNYSSRTCTGSWETLNSYINRSTKEVQGNSFGFSSYFLAENKCGNGLCERNYLETTSSCSLDCKETANIVPSSGGSGGGGGSGVSLEQIKNIFENFYDIGGIKIETTSIYKELFAGESASARVTLANTLTTPVSMRLTAEGDIEDFIFFADSSLNFEGKESKDLLVKIILPQKIEPKTYEGNLVFNTRTKQGKIPVTIRVLNPEGKLLDIKISPLISVVEPGQVLRLQTDLLNLGQTKKVDVQFDLRLMSPETEEIFTRSEEAFAVESSLSTIKNLTIPKDIVPGKYLIKASVYYSNLEQKSLQASSIAYISVQYPFFKRKLFG
ncbi:MAG: hypothetical protein GYA36_15905, partial [Veillonellaceae bacterium]|nr:hypothetical protein [Veillonellaceae bacterium]